MKTGGHWRSSILTAKEAELIQIADHEHLEYAIS